MFLLQGMGMILANLLAIGIIVLVADIIDVQQWVDHDELLAGEMGY